MWLLFGWLGLIVVGCGWFVGTMECVVNRSQSGTVISWAVVRDCSY